MDSVSFADRVKPFIHFLLTARGWELVHETPIELAYHTEALALRFHYFPYGNECSFALKGNDGREIELNDEIVTTVFQQPIHLLPTTKELFGENLRVFFEGPGEKILATDQPTIGALYDAFETHQDNYWAEVQREQHFKALDEAWSREDFPDFIEEMKKMENGDIPKAYRIKLAIALRYTGSEGAAASTTSA